ncbi:hypothetical protein TSUD_285010 [Trifolium subterraneum]|uniref:Uncharacterized protein n=1 Tax=Trifolium subterraneum TaxID=3900 RepID=A0A2Z6NXT6_TRISU|nr:hypothetical protein TSUD_285010 [Trifolium subterraneum]
MTVDGGYDNRKCGGSSNDNMKRERLGLSKKPSTDRTRSNRQRKEGLGRVFVDFYVCGLNLSVISGFNRTGADGHSVIQ